MTSVAGLTLTDELTHEICEWVMSGRPLAEYCATAGKPSLNTINNWRHTNDIFAKRFSQARDIGFDSIAERLRTTVRGGDERLRHAARARQHLFAEEDAHARALASGLRGDSIEYRLNAYVRRDLTLRLQFDDLGNVFLEILRERLVNVTRLEPRLGEL
jgi:hypothetical protein